MGIGSAGESLGVSGKASAVVSPLRNSCAPRIWPRHASMPPYQSSRRTDDARHRVLCANLRKRGACDRRCCCRPKISNLTRYRCREATAASLGRLGDPARSSGLCVPSGGLACELMLAACRHLFSATLPRIDLQEQGSRLLTRECFNGSPSQADFKLQEHPSGVQPPFQPAQEACKQPATHTDKTPDGFCLFPRSARRGI